MMLNFIRFDLKKMLKSPALYVIICLMFLIGGIGYHVTQRYGYGQDYQVYKQKQDQDHANYEKKATKPADEQAGIEFEPAPSPTLDEETYQVFHQEAYANFKVDRAAWSFMMNMAKFAWIFFVLFLGIDFSSGYLKNLLPLGNARRSWLFAKFAVALAYGALSLLLGLAFGPITHYLSGQAFSNLDFLALGKHFILVECLLLTIMAICSLITLLSQSRTVSVLIGALVSVGMLSSLISFIGQWLQLPLAKWLFFIRYEGIDFGQSGQFLELLLLALSQIILVTLFNYQRIHKMDFHFDH
ncbi:ABC transporter permease subunit [Aerococcus urinae]|uniref:ABC transporter permease subunit n=1 Tax=Aerococcus urinae TaxID=1376 RepID=UPI00254E0E1A|nr:ABC transporter permease subunit [Aerococcus urinae]MDK6371799.1 ABC transporter permease subunit [Aerococcus urinae]